jgi:hypothetical protein
LGVLAVQHRDLMAEYQQFGVFGGCRAGEQREPAADADEDQV